MIRWIRIEGEGNVKTLGLRAEFTEDMHGAFSGNFKKAIIALTRIDLWCKENKLGERVAINSFEFINEQSLSYFILKWSDENEQNKLIKSINE